MKANSISTNLMLMATLVAVLNFSSCKKYEDGPGFTLKTKKGRLSREWEVVKMIDADGTIYNLPITVAGYSYGLEMEFEKNGNFTFTYSYTDPGEPTQFDVYDGDWDFSSDKEDLEVEFDGERHVWQILRLTSKELWFEDEDRAEWHLEAK